MRKTTVNLVIGILFGIAIVKVSDVATNSGVESVQKQSLATPSSIVVKPAQNEQENFFGEKIAPGLQIVKVPPPLDLNGLHPYQCYINGKSVSLPVQLIEEIICEHGDPSENDSEFNVHNFTSNLKYVTTPPLR